MPHVIRASSSPTDQEPSSVAQPVFLTTTALAERWHTSPGRLANMRCNRQGVPWVKVGNRVLYPLVEVEAYERANLVHTSGAAA